MKRKPNILLAAGVVALGLLLTALFAHTAHAQETIGVDPGPFGKPAYNFAFDVPVVYTNSIKLEFFDNKTLKAGPGTTGFMFTSITDSGIPYSGVLLDANGEEIPGTEFDGVTSVDGAEIDFQEATVWSSILFKDGAFSGPNWLIWVAGHPVVVGEPVTIGGTVSGLFEGGVLALQNNSADDLEITEDGPFTFEMPLDPGTDYNVTVLTQPEGQSCSVENGSGTVPGVDVTDVAVTCGELVVGDVSNVAAEGDTLGDTVLMDILLSGGLAINIDGQVAFAGRDEDGTDAAFTQAGKVAAEGETLTDGTVLSTFREQGELAIGGVQSSERVAFHGQDSNRIVGVFTQAGLVAAEGDTLPPDGTPLQVIIESGGVAINEFAEVAFHGQTGTTDAVFVGLAKLPNLPPIADFSFETANLDANFTDLSQDSDGEVVAWSWSFGDDSTSTEQNPRIPGRSCRNCIVTPERSLW